jgi:Family of unknown function (DUF6515)
MLKKHGFRKLLLLAFLGCSLFDVMASQSFGQPGRRDRDRDDRRRPRVVVKPRYISAPPRGHVVVRIGRENYYRHGNVYYRRVRRGREWAYIEIAPPIGAAIAVLPRRHSRVFIGGRVYYQYGATFYAPVVVGAETTYVVARPPIGAVLDTVPTGSTAVAVDGANYFTLDGVYFLPIALGTATKYVIVAKP